MKVYIKKKNENQWHWILECPHYPDGDDVDIVYRKPAKEKLCHICIQLEAEGKNKIQKKEILGDESLI